MRTIQAQDPGEQGSDRNPSHNAREQMQALKIEDSAPLAPDTELGAFAVTGVLTQSAHSITYLARDIEDGMPCLLVEYFPVDAALRHPGSNHLVARTGYEQVFEEGLIQFLQVARNLTQIHDPHVMRITQYNELNGSAYMVAEHEPGQLLSTYLGENEATLRNDALTTLLHSLLKGLTALHEHGLIHRDIHPGHILLRAVGPPLLIGFGANRQILPPGSPPDILAARATPGYAPVERYQLGGRIQASTDLYSLAAVAYRCITGLAPIDAKTRITATAKGGEDPLVPAGELTKSTYNSGLLNTINWMLQPIAPDRPHSAAAVLGLIGAKPRRPSAFAAAPNKTAPAVEASPASPAPPPAQNARSARTRWIVSLAALAALIGGWSLWNTLTPSTPTTIGSPGEPVSPAPSATAAAPPTVVPPANDTEFARPGDNQRVNGYRNQQRIEAKVAPHLDTASKLIDQDTLVGPSGANALDEYRAVLALDPDNAAAHRGIDNIANIYIARTRAALQKSDLDLAQQQLGIAHEVKPNNPDLKTLNEVIGTMRTALAIQQQQRKQQATETAPADGAIAVADDATARIDALRVQAHNARLVDRGYSPDGNSAVDYYREILAINPDDTAARTGLQSVQDQYLSHANNAILGNRFDAADRWLTTAERIDPTNNAVVLLRRQLDARRTAFQQAIASHKTAARQQATAPPPAVTAPTAGGQEIGITAYYRGAYSAAFRLLKPLADGGDPRAQYRVSVMYDRGRGVARNSALAREYAERALPAVQTAAREGKPWAQADLGSIYEDGKLMPRNYRIAADWYRRAASQGYAGAQTNLGVLYASGQGVPRDLEKAVEWLRRAATQGDKVAQENLDQLNSASQAESGSNGLK